MIYRLMADFLVTIHFLFIIFALLGGLLILWRKWVIYWHIPCALWGMWIELSGGLCPLTDLENDLRLKSGLSGYSGGFVEHYIIPIIYPEALTRELQLILGIVVLIVNLLIYSWVIYQWKQNKLT